MHPPYLPEHSTPHADTEHGPVVLEFGTNWCGYCREAQPLIEAALAGYPSVRHIKVEDGKGGPLGRAFRVKLWPTLVFLHDGVEIERLVRPTSERAIGAALEKLQTRVAR